MQWVYAEDWPGETPPPWGPRREPAMRGARRASAALMPLKTFIEAIRETLAEEMRRDETVIVLGEDVGKKGGVFLATDGLWAEFGEDRVIDTPLTESMIVGASIGAAVNGLRPIAEIQFADFIHPAFNQLVSEAARMRYRSNNGFGVPMACARRTAAASTARCITRSRSRRFSPTCRGSRSSSPRPRTTPGPAPIGDP